VGIKTIQEAVYETVHRSRKPPKQIADEMGISYSYLMRMGLDGESGCDINAKYLVPLMSTTSNYELLKVLNQLCGFLPPVKPPRGWKNGPKQEVHEYQTAFNQLIGQLLAFIQNPSEALLKDLNQSMMEHMSHTEAMRQRCVNKLINQGELFND